MGYAKHLSSTLKTQFKEFLASKGVNAPDLLNQGWNKTFEYFTRCKPSAYRRELLENLDTLEAVIHKVVNTYGVLRMKENEVNALKENGSQLHDEILHEHQIKSSVKTKSQDIQIKPVEVFDNSLIVSKGSLIEPENNDAFSKPESETHMQRQEEKVNMREAVDAGLVVTESSGTNPDKQNTSSSSGSYTTQAVDADIRPVIDKEPFAEVQLTALHNILANEQQHTEQSEPSYDTHLLETIESNTTPTSTNMCHRGGEIDQDALLKTELLKTKDMVDKEIYNELSKDIYNWKNIYLVENADLKAQIREKVFANAALKMNLEIVRQPNAFTSERPRISRPRFASQVDEKNDLSKTVTPHYLPKVRESAAATPHQVNAPNYSRNSHKESYGSNDMVHAYFLEDARKMTQDKTRIPSHKDMASTRAHYTPNACTPKPRNIYRSSPVSKCSGGMSNAFKPRLLCQKMHGQTSLDLGSSILDDVEQNFKPRSLMSNWRLLASSSSLFLIVKKGVPSEKRKVTCPSDLRDNLNIKGMVKLKARSLSNSDYILCFVYLCTILTDTMAEEIFMHLTTDEITDHHCLEQLQIGKGYTSLRSQKTEPMQEDQTGSNSGKLHVSLAGPNPEHHDDNFLVNSLPKVTSTPPVIAPFTDVSSTKPSSLVTPPPIRHEATTINTSPPEITPFTPCTNSSKMEQEITKFDMLLLKILERHTADLIEKYSALPGLESIKNQESEKSPKRYQIKGNKCMDKEMQSNGKDHKRKHDSDDEEDDDDDEGPSAGSNQGRSAKRRRPESAASGSAQPPSKNDHQNSFIVSKKRSSNSSKKLKGIQTLTPAEQEAADIMKALKESKKMSKRQPGTGGSNEGTGNILGVPDESTVISRASSEGTGSKPGVPDEEKLIL
ncbi:hypothetical protein Tco_0568331 [Tanacetum coccineum]